jgi:hypothetical protein
MSMIAFAGRALRRSAAIAFLIAASCTDTENERSLTAPVTPVPANVVSAYDILKMSGPVTLDGNLSDWAGVSAIPTFADDPARGTAANSASVKMAWDGTYLYAAYTMTDTELLADQTQTTRDAPQPVQG